MPTTSEGKRLQALETGATQATTNVYSQPAFFQRPAGLSSIVPGLAQSTTFLPPGVVNPSADSFGYQRMPGAQYGNYAMAAPNVGGPLTAPQVPAGFVPAGTQPETIRVYPDGTPVGDEEEEDDSPISASDKALERINEMRIAQGQEPFESMAEFQADLRRQIGIGMPGGFNPFGGRFAEGGIASLEPMYMNQGGFSSFMTNLGGKLTGFSEALGGGGFGGGGQEETGRASGRTYADSAMGGGQSVESLLETIRKLKEELAKKDRERVTDLLLSGPKTDPMRNATPPIYGGFAAGGDVDFPRMNGPISGPGTETSDDIPAMLSDGEFVVNAKAVRGIGRLEGAGKSKEEQRREGARMMYALQRAGEKAMRKA
jgi:hypothetical protein